MDIKNPKYSSPDGSLVDVTWNHPLYGEIPFTIDTSSPDETMKVMMGSINAGDIEPFTEVSVPAASPESTPLTPRQFARFTALYGYDDAIEEVLAGLKDLDRAMYARIKGDVTGAGSFNFSNVIEILSSDSVKAVIPNGIDVSEGVIAERWMEASGF